MAKKIRLWSILLCVLACLCFGVAFSFVPKAKADEASNPEKVVVLSPENSENFSSLVQKTGGGLTEVDGETVYDSKGWYGFSYNQIVSEYTATIEFKTSDSGSDLRIYINSATIGGAMDYVFRFYQGYLMVYEPEKTDKRNWNTSSNFIFKTTPANYRNGEWHTFTINLYKGQFFVTMDGQFIPNTNNMKNPDKYSDTTNHMYTNMIKDAETGVSSEVEIDEGYVGIYGKDFYVRTFEVDLYDTDESVGKKQFATSHQVYADIKTASTAGYSEEQFNSILALGQNAISEINLAVTENEVAAAYANFTKRVESLGFVYEYDFSSSASGASDFTLSGGTLTTENGVNTITAGSSWTVANYNGGWEHYAQFTATMNLGVSSGDVRVYFYTNPEENEGYLLRFYAGMTILYQSPFEGTADYWNYPQNGSGVIKRSDINFQDGKDHVISFAFYENQFYLTLDGEFFNAESVFDTGFADNVYTKTDGEGNGVNYSYFSFSFAGTNFTVKNAETTCYGLMEEVGSKQFENVFAIYEHIEGLDKHLYGGNSWSEVLAVANSYVGEIVASYDEEPSQIDGLLAEAISAINAVEPVLTFDINEDFEDGTNDEISVKSGTNSVMGTENNRYLSVSSTWNVFSTNEITKDYILSFDFRAGTEKALYFNFNTQVANGSRVNCYSVRLYASGASQSVQLYKGVESEGNLAWIYTHASSTYYRDDNWHNLKVISADGKFTLYLDDTNIVPTSKSNNYTMDKGVLVDESFKMGYFGMQSQAPVDIDNFSVQPVESFEDAVY
ncbi:MAG: hypothetical protein IKZ28_02770, partial [Clostridia bacterium]|nr:hypothetical protein [Clostridia bacterium]